MFLKSLSMKGFKSFADPMVLEFEPGLTVVVGPNGSGKSNVVDAVTWVLGAQGPRSLRSQKMEDVIFAGTSSRPALGRAEVSLTIDNSSGKLPVPMAEVTISRTLFRSGDSEYAINGTPCRLLDIQDLLNDSGVGRQQHMIIGQNQLDTVLTARPEDRRAVIEEAAGVLKHRRRRERAERRLAVTQENLERLGDLVRELRRQIRPLERQAAAARSHAQVAAELRALRVHLAGAELTELGKRKEKSAADLAALADEEARLRAALDALDAQAAATTAELSSGREQDLAGALATVQALVERAKGTTNVLRERSRALAQALDAAADVDVVSTLEADAARLVEELREVDVEELALAPERDELAARAAALAADDDAHALRWGGGAELDAATRALDELRRRIELQARAAEHDEREIAALDERLAAVRVRATGLIASVEELDARLGALDGEAERLAAAVTDAEERHATARAAAQQAEEDVRTADQERHRSAARAEALARALHELEGAGGRELLSDVDGVIGSLVDLVEIDPGWEAAFEAAVGATAAAVVVSGRDAARTALARLHGRGATGALLPAGAGVRRRPPIDVPPGAMPLRPHVRIRRPLGADVDDVLDALVGGAVRVDGWEAALDLALDRPDLVVVTPDGDRFAGSGWRVRSSSGIVTAAAVEDAERRATDAAMRADRATAALTEARRVLDAAASHARDAARTHDRHEAARAGAAAERRRAGEERARVASELGEGDDARRALVSRLDANQAELATLEGAVADAEAQAAAARAHATAAAAAVDQLTGRRRELAAAHHALEVRGASVAERRRVLTARQAEVERRLAGHGEERDAAARRRQRLEADGIALDRLQRVVVRERDRLEAVLDSLRRAYADQSERLRAGAARMESIRSERAVLEQQQIAARERARVVDREAAEASLRAEALVESVEHELGVTPAEAQAAPLPEVPEGVTAAGHAGALATKLASLGPVNPLALDELSALEERHRELDTQMEDVRSARRQLHEVVRSLDREIAEEFAAAMADVNEHFSTFVGSLFPGGTGRLTLTEPSDLLNTGVEIEVRPAGRNVRRVSLLSGGERSMAALAFLFAVFRSRPSPFYLMDEVEAALDDVNLHRLLGLVHEFRNEAQLIVVSHQKRTMEAADALYGVTMAPGGSSQVVSQRARAEAQPVG
ncbi:MAG TPA: chromosome segregation protein SMC [Acidimicrobiales bacterium]|nr:chromosome segregation protein SMC [Acidimicrobiales bacterium]